MKLVMSAAEYLELVRCTFKGNLHGRSIFYAELWLYCAQLDNSTNLVKLTAFNEQ